jgi:hypothetical protein
VQEPDESLDNDPAAIGIRLRRAALAVSAVALVAAPGVAGASLTTLPSPFFPLRAEPPLRGSAAATETRFPGRLSSTQTVSVSIDSSGQAFRVIDVDRIGITQKGDYSFVLAAPVKDVRAAAGSASEPGLRSGAVVWQGFSPGRRLLAAVITLRAEAAVSALPLRIAIEGSGLRLVNTTSASSTTVDANVPAAEIARALDAARAALKGGTPTPAPIVSAVGAVREVHVVARVPLRVRGTVRFAGAPPRSLDAVVGQDPLRIAGAGALKAFELSVSVPEPAAVLRPPGARRWLDLVRSGRLAGGRSTTRLAVNRLLAAALALHFRQFLPNPDVNGITRTSYRYALAERPQAAKIQAPGGRHGWPVSVAVLLGLVAAAVGALVLWAHS